MKKMAGFGLTLLTALVLTGCTQRLGDFTLLSSKNVAHVGTAGPRVKGDDCAWIVLWFPTGVINMKNAVDKAIENAGPGYDALSDAVLRTVTWDAVFAGQMCYEVEGTALKTGGTQSSLYKPSLFYHSSLLNGRQRAAQEASLHQMLLKSAN